MDTTIKILLAYVTLIIALLAYINLGSDYVLNEKVIMINHDINTAFSNASDSMGLTFSPRDSILLEAINNDTQLRIGRVYVYEEDTKIIGHRLANCLTVFNNEIIEEKVCKNYLIFKGDNNEYAELVTRDQVKYFVKGALYG